MQRALRSFNYDVMLAENVQGTIEVAISYPPDLSIVDLMMPVLDELESIKRICKNPRMRAVPIIAITAQFGSEIRDKRPASGFSDIIRKPFPIGELCLWYKANN